MAQGKKTGGRKKGTPNKTTSQLRQAITSILNDEFEKLPETLEELEPAERIDAIIKLAKFVLPTIGNVPSLTVDEQAIDPEYHVASIEKRLTDQKIMDGLI